MERSAGCGDRKALVIGIDGCRPDALQAADTPNLDGLIERGAYSFEAQTDPITISGPGGSSLLTGVWSDKHGVVDNDFGGKRYDKYPHFLRRVKDHDPSAVTAYAVNWKPLESEILHDTDIHYGGISDKKVTQRAVEILTEHDPAAVFLCYDNIDEAGHAHGYDSPYGPESEYRKAIEETDERIGDVLEALHSRPHYDQEEWLVVAATDHGGSGTAHGEDIPEHRDVFIIASGGRVRAGRIVPEPVIVDIVPAVLMHLGVLAERDGNASDAVVGWGDS